ncbi:MAG: hypothetical protein J5806_11765 [Lentisphaeria bacterium]|nr:hypothetical protein [Lentisphaeria bacterium]
MTEIFCWSGLMLLFSAVLWAIPKTRRATGIFLTGGKTVPVGCSVMVLMPVAVIAAMRWFRGIMPHLPIPEALDFFCFLSIPFVVFPLGIVFGVLIVAGLCRILRKKYQAEIDPMGFVFAGLMVLLYSWIFLIFREFIST